MDRARARILGARQMRAQKGRHVVSPAALVIPPKAFGHLTCVAAELLGEMAEKQLLQPHQRYAVLPANLLEKPVAELKEGVKR